MAEVDLRLRTTYGWDRLMDEVDLWLRLTYGWGRLKAEDDLWLRSTFDWSRLMTEVDLWLRYLYGWESTVTIWRNIARTFDIYSPVCLKYWRLFSSTGKYPTVAPYSGHMLDIVARSAMDRAATPGPKNSTNLPTTPIERRCWNYSRIVITTLHNTSFA